MYRPIVTIITAVYNRADKIEQCISSVVNQTYDNLEYVVIDGGSTDGTVEIIKKYADKIAYWCSEPDNGIYDAWNKGLRHATGDYINFIGSDDAICSIDTIENIIAYLSDDIDVLAGNVMRVRERDTFEFVQDNEHVKNRDTYKGKCIVTQGTFVKRSICNKYKFDASYKVAADYKFFLQYYHDKSVNIKFIDDVVQYFSDGGVSGENWNWDFVRNEDNRVYNELGLYELVDCHYKEREADSTYKFKEFCKKLGVFELIKKAYHLYVQGDWKKHHCNNRICRWCGRYKS